MAEISKIIAGDVTYHLRDRNYCTCSTGASTADKTASLDGFVLDTGASVKVKFTNTNTAANPTLNINSTGAKSIMQYGTTVAGTTATESWDDGAVVEFVYDGTNWVMQGRNTIDAVSKSAGGTFDGNIQINRANGTDSSVGTSSIIVGNAIAEGTAGNSYGRVQIYGRGANYGTIVAADVTETRLYDLPDESGTLMTNQGGTFTGHIYVDKPSRGTWQGYSSIVLGNDKAVGTDENSRGQVMIYGTGTNFATLNADPTADRTISLPDASGTIALVETSFYGKEIPANQNLNNYTTEGQYYSASSTVSASISNCPINYMGFCMSVYKYNSGLIVQEIEVGDALYSRRYNGSSWTTWRKYLSCDMSSFWSTIAAITNVNTTTVLADTNVTFTPSENCFVAAFLDYNNNLPMDVAIATKGTNNVYQIFSISNQSYIAGSVTVGRLYTSCWCQKDETYTILARSYQAGSNRVGAYALFK